MRLRQKLFPLLLFNTVMIIASPSYATEETTDPYLGTLLSDVGGQRSKLSDAGVDVSVEYKADLWRVTSGGIKTGNNYMDSLDIKFDLDGEKLFGLKGNKSLIYFINNMGGKTNADRVGSVEGIDNLEVGTNTFKLYEAWTEQNFLNDRLAVLIGLHDLNSEFDVTDMSANFIKPTMQMGQSFAQSGQNGPPVFPTTSLAGRIKVAPSDETYISVAAFDGVPGNPAHPHGTHIDLNDDDGVLWVAEIGVEPKLADSPGSAPNKLAIGGWMYSHEMDDLVDVDVNGNPVKQHMAGAYFLSSYQFYHSKEAGHDLGAFLRGGVADGDTAQVNWDYELGVVGNGWVPTRPDSEIGAGFTQAHNGEKFRQSMGASADHSEYGMEIYYRDQITNGIAVQPDLQYVINPGSDKAIKNAMIIGIRFDINL